MRPSETKARTGKIIDYVGPALGQTPAYDLSIDRLEEALGYIAGRMEEDNKGTVIAEVGRDGDAVYFTMYYAAPLQSVLSGWEQLLEERLERADGHLKWTEDVAEENQHTIDAWEKKTPRQQFGQKLLHALSISEEILHYEVSKELTETLYEPFKQNARGARDAVNTELAALRENRYVTVEDEAGNAVILHPYAVGLNLAASASDPKVTLTVHDQETEEQSVTNYRAGLMLAGALMARMPEGLDVVLERSDAIWGYQVPVEQTPEDGTSDNNATE